MDSHNVIQDPSRMVKIGLKSLIVIKNEIDEQDTTRLATLTLRLVYDPVTGRDERPRALFFLKRVSFAIACTYL